MTSSSEARSRSRTAPTSRISTSTASSRSRPTLPFNANVPGTWPVALSLQKPGKYAYDSKQVGMFFQDDWRVAPNVRLNLGFRYDLDTNLRDNDFYASLLANPGVHRHRSFRQQQSRQRLLRLAAAARRRVGRQAARATSSLRAGFGKYWTRMRPWFAQQAEQQTSGAAVRITDPQQLRYYPGSDGGAWRQDASRTTWRRARRASRRSCPTTSGCRTRSISTTGFGWQHEQLLVAQRGLRARPHLP